MDGWEGVHKVTLAAWWDLKIKYIRARQAIDPTFPNAKDRGDETLDRSAYYKGKQRDYSEGKLTRRIGYLMASTFNSLGGVQPSGVLSLILKGLEKSTVEGAILVAKNFLKSWKVEGDFESWHLSQYTPGGHWRLTTHRDVHVAAPPASVKVSNDHPVANVTASVCR